MCYAMFKQVASCKLKKENDTYHGLHFLELRERGNELHFGVPHIRVRVVCTAIGILIHVVNCPRSELQAI